MTPRMQIRIAVAAVILIAVIAAAREAISHYKIARLEKAVATQRSRAAELETAAAAREAEAAAYSKKNEFLERRIAEIREIAQKQDEEINNKTAAVRGARVGRDRARGVRSRDTTVDELCGKLAEAGHPCE